MLHTGDYLEKIDDQDFLGGQNFLVSAVVLLREQRKALQAENSRLKKQLEHLRAQNAEFLDLGANRLLDQVQANSIHS